MRMLTIITITTCLTLILYSGYKLVETKSRGRVIRQRSISCGPHPFTSFVLPGSPTLIERPDLNGIIRAMKADKVIWSRVMDQLKFYDDCIRAGDGLHFKRAPAKRPPVFFTTEVHPF